MAEPFDVVNIQVDVISVDTPGTLRPNSRTPEQLVTDVQNLRGFSSVEPPHALEAAQQKLAEAEQALEANPSNATLTKELNAAKRQVDRISKRVFRIDPEGVGKELGVGYRTFAVVQIVDSDGSLVAYAIGESTGSKKHAIHAEQHIIRQIRKALGDRKFPGGHLDVAVDQFVCPVCEIELRQLKADLQLATVTAHHGIRKAIGPNPRATERGTVTERAVSRPNPESTGKRPKIRIASGEVTPKTAMRTSTMGSKEGRPIPELETRSIEIFADEPGGLAAEPPNRPDALPIEEVTDPRMKKGGGSLEVFDERAIVSRLTQAPPARTIRLRSFLRTGGMILKRSIQTLGELTPLLEFADGLQIGIGESDVAPHLKKAGTIEHRLADELKQVDAYSERLTPELNRLFDPEVDRTLAVQDLQMASRESYEQLLEFVTLRNKLTKTLTEVRKKIATIDEIKETPEARSMLGLFGTAELARLVKVQNDLYKIRGSLSRSSELSIEIIRNVELNRLSILNWQSAIEGKEGFALPETSIR